MHKPHTVDVLTERDGTLVHWADHEVATGDDAGPGGTILPCLWGIEEGRYVVRVRLSGRRTWESIDLTDESDVLCLSISVGDGNTEPQDTPPRTIWHTGNPNKRCKPTTSATKPR